jgi:hypothetical protein
MDSAKEYYSEKVKNRLKPWQVQWVEEWIEGLNNKHNGEDQSKEA